MTNNSDIGLANLNTKQIFGEREWGGIRCMCVRVFNLLEKKLLIAEKMVQMGGKLKDSLVIVFEGERVSVPQN